MYAILCHPQQRQGGKKRNGGRVASMAAESADAACQLSSPPDSYHRTNPSPGCLRQVMHKYRLEFLHSGDLLLCVSNAVAENLFDDEFEAVVNRFEPFSDPKAIAAAVCQAAHDKTTQSHTYTPDGLRRNPPNWGWLKGDMSVVAAWAMRNPHFIDDYSSWQPLRFRQPSHGTV
ncbi:unnamed protein product [Vitrella brassicaformis CCMP3155]|uniref:Uncharacterized protein n=1 Tax=Vitrella brassicaformis (strain CCMP3155) TaxID=1169540 RepID=A0A0G4GEZ6_VITBC|nr:unnamed protein product [Vitrella brassicaformis CCMP3155]|eukprot:CEM28103.1 unnamed protein product [Vitrella brassicaformis CCMP3155]